MNELILPPESDDGNTEYKWKLTNLSSFNIEKKMTQLKFRLEEGNGEAMYYIGVKDDGEVVGLNLDEHEESIENLKTIASKIGAHVMKVSTTEVKDTKFFSEFIIRDCGDNSYLDLKVGVVGNVDSGKSTLVGVLTKGGFDNGRGLARSLVFNHKHEVDTGRTSSIGLQILGFNQSGEPVNGKKWTDITSQSTKVITFYDLAGHEKYLRTTIYGLSSSYPDYCLVIVGGNMGLNHMTREHISLCLGLKIPFIIIVTKVDIAPVGVLEETMRRINQICKKGARKIPYNIKNKDDVLNVTKNIKSGSIIPILQLSNVTGSNVNLLRTLLNLLPIRNDYSQKLNSPVEILIDSNYHITGHGTVVSGLLTSGTVKINDTVFIGPLHSGEYLTSKIKSIHVKHKDVKEAKAGTYVCVGLKNTQRKMIKKGMVLIGDKAEKLVVREFWAKMNIFLSQHTTIKVGYQPYLHIGHVRQCAQIVEIKKLNKGDSKDEVLRTGDRAYVKMKFMSKGEYIRDGTTLIFREGRVKAFGIVCSEPQ